MKKSLVLLSFITLAIASCTSNSASETISNAEVTDASTAWQTDVQQAQMPSGMTQPTYQTPNYSVPQPISSSYGNTETIGNCQVVRDAANKPIYSQIQKGCYTDSTYTVGAHDTLYLIGYLTGTNANQIATMNGLNPTAKLKVGKVLRVR